MTKRLTLIAALYVHPGREAEFGQFEAAAAEIMQRYGGTIERPGREGHDERERDAEHQRREEEEPDHQHQPGELVFDRSYRGGPRSDDFMLFHITTGRDRSKEAKARLYRRLVELLAQAPGVRPEDVMVIIANSTFDDWSFASGEQASTSGANASGGTGGHS